MRKFCTKLVMEKETIIANDAERVRVNLHLPKRLFQYIDYVASIEDKTLTAVIRDAISEKMDRDKTIERNEDASQC